MSNRSSDAARHFEEFSNEESTIEVDLVIHDAVAYKKLLEEARKRKLEELKLQVIARNPTGLMIPADPDAYPDYRRRYKLDRPKERSHNWAKEGF